MLSQNEHSGFEVDYVVIGAGPAGLQLGYYLRKAGRDYVILEKGEGPGTFFKDFPRHRMLISINKVYTGTDDAEANLRWDWNSLLSEENGLLFKEYSRDYFPDADALVSYLHDYAKVYELNVRYGVNVMQVEKGERFRVSTEGGDTYLAKRLIVATGLSLPYIPQIPGIELTENYVDVNVDPEDFADQHVLVLGKGNSALETADNLVGTTALMHVASPNPVKMAWKTHFVGHLRAVNNNFLDTYQLKSQNAVLDCMVDKIEQREDGRYAVAVSYSHASNENEVLVYDRIITCTGFRFDTSLFAENCKPELTIHDRFPKLTSAWESTNIPGLYVAGALTQSLDFKKTTSGFIHGFRYNIRSLHRILEARYHDVAWPSREIDASPPGLTEAVIERVNSTSALWQQFGFLGDLIVVEGDRGTFYEELPTSWIQEDGLGSFPEYYVLTLEFGPVQEDPFNILRDPDPAKAADSAFLHPVLRHYVDGELEAEHHLLEDLYGEWRREDLHIEPLQEFFCQQAPVAPALV